MANFIESKRKQLNNALTANIYNEQVAWAKSVGTDTPEDYIDRTMSIETAIEYSQV